jgi:hypothetical protein
MIPVTQTRLHIKDRDGNVTQKGNCFQAAVASIMDLPLDEVPNFIEYSDDEWFEKFIGFLDTRGYEYAWHYVNDGREIKGYSIGSGISPRATKDCRITHAVICLDGEMVFDVHPSRDGVLGRIYMHETITKKVAE